MHRPPTLQSGRIIFNFDLRSLDRHAWAHEVVTYPPCVKTSNDSDFLTTSILSSDLPRDLQNTILIKITKKIKFFAQKSVILNSTKILLKITFSQMFWEIEIYTTYFWPIGDLHPAKSCSLEGPTVPMYVEICRVCRSSKMRISRYL